MLWTKLTMVPNRTTRRQLFQGDHLTYAMNSARWALGGVHASWVQVASTRLGARWHERLVTGG